VVRTVFVRVLERSPSRDLCRELEPGIEVQNDAGLTSSKSSRSVELIPPS
jgi:hypothetical protein